MIAPTVTPLRYFLRSGRAGSSHACRDLKTSETFNFYPPNGRLTPTVPDRDLSKITVSLSKSPLPDNSELNYVPSRSAVPVKLPAAHFVTSCLKDSDKSMKNIGPFCIHKAPVSVAVKVTKASRLKNGHYSRGHGMKTIGASLKGDSSWIKSRARGDTRS
jgi:hypothetical protein